VHFFVLFAFELACPAQEGALDVVIWHVLVLGGGDRGAQPRIRVGIASANARGDRNFANQFGENPPALCVGRSFLVFNRGPFRMPGHRIASSEVVRFGSVAISSRESPQGGAETSGIPLTSPE